MFMFRLIPLNIDFGTHMQHLKTTFAKTIRSLKVVIKINIKFSVYGGTCTLVQQIIIYLINRL